MRSKIIRVTSRVTSRLTSRLTSRVAGLALVPLAMGACDWMTDFKRQPAVHPWGVYRADSAELKGFRGQPVNSVSTQGTLVPAWAVSYAPMPATIDSMSSLPNPVAPDARSLANGRKYYQITCAPCHGDAGEKFSPAVFTNSSHAFCFAVSYPYG